MPDEPPRDDEADFLDFLRDDESAEEDEPAEPPKGQEGDLVVLEHGAEVGKGSEDFREAEEADPEGDEAPGEKFRDEVPSAEEAGSDEVLGWLDGAAKDSLEGPKLEEMMTQEMTEMGEDVPEESPEALLVDDEAEEPVEAVVEEEIEEEADLIFGEEPRKVPAAEEPPPAKAEPEAAPAIEKQSYDDFREESAVSATVSEEVGEEAAAEFDAFISEEAPAPDAPSSDEMAAAVAETQRTPATGESLFRFEDGTPIPVLPAALGGYRAPSQPEFGPKTINYPVIRTPAPVGLIILVILVVAVAAAGYFYRTQITGYASVMWNEFMGSSEVEPVPTPTGTAAGETGTSTVPSTATSTTPTSTAGSTQAATATIQDIGLYQVTLNGKTYHFLPRYKDDVRDYISFIQSMQSTGLGKRR